jgi:glycine oxidase
MDCIVVGGGIIGMMTARELAAAGCRVRIVERGILGAESSWAGGGILSPVQPWRAPAAVTRLAAWGQGRYPELAAELAANTGIDPEWARSGLLVLDSGETDQAGAWAGQNGVECEIIDDPNAIATLEPACRPASRALWFPAVAQIRNPRLIHALRDELERSGVVCSEQSTVTELLCRDGRVYGVRTEQQDFHTDAVVVAAGAWSAQILAALAIRIEVVPVRGQMLLYRTAPGYIRHILLDGDHYLIPRNDGRVLVGSTVEYAGFDKQTTADARRELQRAAESMAGGLARCEIERQWSGLRPGSATEIPYIGPVPGMENLYLNTGHFRNGLLLAPASARLLADLMLARKSEFDPRPYAINL